MPNISTSKLGRQQMLIIARSAGFSEAHGNAIVTYLFQCRNFRIPGVSIFRSL